MKSVIKNRKKTMRRHRVLTWLLILSFLSVVWFVVQYYILNQVEHDNKYYLRHVPNIPEEPYNLNTNWNCSQLSRVKVLIVVHSAVAYLHKRSAIRNTWANISILRSNDMRIVFFVGLTRNKAIQYKVEQESLIYDDIVQGQFYDSYYNLTRKGRLWLRWVDEHCPEAETVLKVDDDVFVNTLLLAKIYKLVLGHFDMTCDLRPKGGNGIFRNPGDKWRVNMTDFSQYKYYPMDTCRGYFVLSSTDAIRTMYMVSKRTAIFWIDDIYLFGILTEKINLKQKHLAELVDEKLESQERGFECFQLQNSDCNILGVLLHTHILNIYMKILWDSIYLY